MHPLGARKSAMALSKTQLRTIYLVVFLDVPTEDEFAYGHLPGAVNISHTNIVSRLSALPSNKSTTVVLHCQTGNRAELPANVLREAGFNNPHILSGHYAKWNDRNLPLEQGITR
jgi:rhodanese-related sulfurtransferase